MILNRILSTNAIDYMKRNKYVVVENNGNLKYAIENKLPIIIHKKYHQSFLSKLFNYFRLDISWNKVLVYSCSNGDIESVRIAIGNGVLNWNGGLHGACRGGHKDIVELMIEKGANNWNEGLYGACHGGHKNIVELMIEKGATYCVNCCRSMGEHLKK
jgi:hypothetical protein